MSGTAAPEAPVSTLEDGCIEASFVTRMLAPAFPRGWRDCAKHSRRPTPFFKFVLLMHVSLHGSTLPATLQLLTWLHSWAVPSLQLP